MARILPSRALTRGPTEQPNDWCVTKGRHAVEAFEDSDDGKCSILVVNNIDRLHLGISKIADDVLSIIDASGARMVLDDVQISLGARAGASVGPHTDSYSVFLLQVGSPKRWVVSSGAVDSLAPHVDDAHVADCPVRVLSDSAIAESKAELLETVVQPGDALYVPPHCVHYGSSVDDSDNYTYSVGVLAPSAQDVLLSFAAFASEQAALTNHANGSTRRFDIVHEVAALDEERELSAAHGTISHAHVRATQAFLRSLADDEDLVREWLGEHFTEAGMHVMPAHMPLDNDEPAVRAPGSRILFDAARSCLYANGHKHALSEDNAGWAQSLADEGIARRCVTDGEKVLAALLLEEGAICVAADAEELARVREEETMQQGGEDYWLGSDMAGNPDDGWSDVGWGADDPND